MALQLSILVGVLILLVMGISRWGVHPFMALLLSAVALGLLWGLGGTQTIESLLNGFGNTMKWIAVVVVLGAFIGEVLQTTGGAARIAEAMVRKSGERNVPWAMGITGYIVSIPVFVDVAYIILQPVTEALSARSKKPILVVGLALAAGLTVSHTLIPPTPGPLAVAAILEADLGRMLLINALVGIFAMVGGIWFVVRTCKNRWLPYDQKIKDTVLPESEDQSPSLKIVSRDLLPIAIPILLMALGAFLKPEDSGTAIEVLRFVSTPMVAVLFGAGAALISLRISPSSEKPNALIEKAIVKSALVLMITGAGGALGQVIKDSGVQEGLSAGLAGMPLLGFLLPFLVAAALTTSTGSITVSLISTASIMGPLVDTLPISAEMTGALIGAGALCVFHANSSFFWLLNRLHEIPVTTLYRSYTLQSLFMGICALIGIGVLALLGFS
ncbi:MAG: GntP family permease [Saprospiraceae bacterium]|nr:GntP family permease [Saprospiraceae bacterium]